VHSSDRS